MRALRKLLGLDGIDEARDSATVRRIATELDRLEPAEARYLAAFAYVLARVAYADLEVSSEEIDAMVELVREYSDLSPAQATLVVELARTQQIALGGTENYLVTRQFRELASRAQRVDLMRCLFGVAAADDSISERESQEILRIGGELGFTREEIAGVRAAFRDQLAVLRDLPE
jgi:uncharacterized tellurite resistance protein B-like protein